MLLAVNTELIGYNYSPVHNHKRHSSRSALFAIICMIMDSNVFMGLLIGAIATLLGIASVIATLIVKPIINLNKSITKLNDSIDRLNEDQGSLRDRVSKHGKEIDANREKLIAHDKEIEHIKEKIK